MKARTWIVGGLAALAIIAGVNYARVTTAAAEATTSLDVTVAGYYRLGIVPDVITFDLWNVGPGESAASVIGGFLRFAEEMKDRRFREVWLAYRGEPRFVLDGRDFQTIGREYSWQNPIYTVRTLPSQLRTPSGGRPFRTHFGGIIGVAGSQIRDVNEFAREWFMDDLR